MSGAELCGFCDHGTDPRTLTTCNYCEGTGRVISGVQPAVESAPIGPESTVRRD